MKAFRFFAGVTVALVLAAGPLASEAQALTKPALLWCQNCSADQKAALAKTPPAGTTVYIADAVQHTIEAYVVGQYDEPIDGTTRVVHIKNLQPIAVDPTISQGIHHAMDYYNAPPVGMTKIIPAGQGHPGSVYDVVNAGSPSQNGFVDWVNKHVGTDNALAGLADSGATGLEMLHIFDSSSTPVFGYKITFEDGSSIEAIWDRATASFKVDSSTARDAEGNTVPYLGLDGKVHNLGGVREFNGSTATGTADVDKFLGQLSLMGVPVGSPSGSSGGWACTKVGGSEYVCKLYPD